MGCAKQDIPPFAWVRWGVCRACPHYDASLNRRSIGCSLAPHLTRCYRRRPMTVCPDSPPRWGPVSPDP